MAQAALKLVPIEGVDNVLRFERRGARRRLLSGRVTSVQQSVDKAEAINRIGSLQLLDISDLGLGAVVPQPVETGTLITVYFAPHGPEMGFERVGQVVRCHSGQGGYQIGIRFLARSAA